ncbi:hypothetical protein CWI38_0086p0070 [Hamiltosporidium tvaerminnensis]|uniref:Uncharacterized protein n=1 Tax=Hamiltosporidium tvaerminnensis TaxID=1176355 RepID=A0A4Q9M109_9MICR|nr:hypothetical protein CWI38_0086p0070 [Hamiltosporidium tvaerminnensis]
MCQYCIKSGKTVDHLATRCEKILGHDYTRLHNEVVRCLHLFSNLIGHTVQEILENEHAEIRVDTRIKTDVKIRNNRSDMLIFDKKKNKITFIELEITFQDSFKYTRNDIVTKYHKPSVKKPKIPHNVEAYIQSIVLKKTVETISFDRRRVLESGLNAEESWETASMGVIMRAKMHEEPTPPLKEAKREEDGAKNLKPKNNTPLISQRNHVLGTDQ